MKSKVQFLLVAWVVVFHLLPSLAYCEDKASPKGASLSLVTEGKTGYQVVKPEGATRIDEYAANTLALYLREMTGAGFPVVGPGEADPERKSIFVGLSKPALSKLGKNPADSLTALKDDQYVARSIGEDILLCGRGIHGNLHAVMDFLENSMGWRWYTLFENPVLLKQPTVVLNAFERKRERSFPYLDVDVQRSMDYPYQLGATMRFDSRVKELAARTKGKLTKEDFPFVSAIPEPFLKASVHTLYSFIPPTPDALGAQSFDWLENKNYFRTNPDFFSMNEQGKRVAVNGQLDFGDPELRKEFTKNVLKFIEVEGDEVLFNITAMDNPGRFSYSPESMALEKKYQSPGGPLYDYLIELCGVLKEKHPKVKVKMLAYRRAQTQKPPVLPKGGKLPENLIIEFAPIEDNYFADWTHLDERIQETYADFKGWSKIVAKGNLWAWIYPNPYGSGASFPVGNIDRLVTTLRLMHKAGVRGIFIDQQGAHARSAWSELQMYLIYKLTENIDRNEEEIIEEFTGNVYGPAAPLIRKYLVELEAGRKAMKELPPNVSYRSALYDEKTFPYLTAENIDRWQGYFDEMEKLVAGEEDRVKTDVKLARRSLDLATLWKWFDLKKAYPDRYLDHTIYGKRIVEANATEPQPVPEWEPWKIDRSWKKHPFGVGLMKDFSVVIEAGGQSKPLPGEFAGIDKSLIQQLVPIYPNNRRGRKIIKDPDAAFGYGVPVDHPELPFHFGFYQSDRNPKNAETLPKPAKESLATWTRAANGSYTLQRSLTADEIDTGKYRIYKLGEIEVTPDCFIWFSASSWATKLELGERLYEPGGKNLWDAYASIKFLGPTYGKDLGEGILPVGNRSAYQGKDGKDLILVDRIILVNRSGDQFDLNGGGRR